MILNRNIMDLLIENAKQAQYSMSPEERESSREQAALSFAYGNVAMSNPSVTMDDIRKAAAKLSALRLTTGEQKSTTNRFVLRQMRARIWSARFAEIAREGSA